MTRLALLATLVWLSPARAEFDVAALEALLANSPRTHQPVDTIAELVPLLPDELRQNFTFVYRSRSPFRTSISETWPRVILFSRDGTFVATFTGDPKRPGHDILETLAFDRQSARFVPRLFALPAARREPLPKLATQASCARCHGTDTRPIYDAYPLWPGFYGSIQDTFPDELSGPRELAAYRRFLRKNARSGVYKDLLFVQGSPVSPYRDPRRFSRQHTAASDEDLIDQPNTRLGMALAELNRKRIMRRLLDTPAFVRDEAQLLASLLECDDADLAEEPFVAAIALENRGRYARMGLDPARLPDARFDMQEILYTRNLARIDRMARQVGVDRGDWSMALEPYAVSFYDGILPADNADGFSLSEDFIVEIFGHLAQKRPSLATWFEPVASFPDEPFGHKIDIARAQKACAELLKP